VIKHAVSKAGGEVAEVEVVGTTDTCSVCGTHFEAGPGIMGRCERGHEMDQDWNATRNICANRAEAAVA
jgi:transposase